MYRRGTLNGWTRLLSVLAVIASTPVTASPLEQVVQYAIDTHPDIAQAVANQRATYQELRQAEGLYWPQIDLEADTGPEWAHGNGTPQTGNPRWEDPEWTNQATISLKETVFDKFRSSENDRQQARVNAASHRIRERVEVVSLDVVQAYLDVLRHREIITLAEENLQRHKETLDKVQQRLTGGQSGIGDLRQAEARLANALATLAQSKRDLDEAEIGFHRLVGRYPKSLSRPAFDDTMLPSDLETAIRVAIDHSPAIALTAADLDVAQMEIRQSDANFWPTLDAEVVSTYNDNINGQLGDRRDTTALLVLRYNLYRGGIDSARKLEAIRRRDQAQEVYRGSVRSTEEETRRSWTAIARLSQRREALAAEELANAQVVATYRQEFDIGQRSLLNLLDSENELFSSQVNRLTAEYAEQFAKYRLLASMGVLAHAMQLSMPPEAYSGKRQADFEWATYRDAEARSMLADDSAESYDGALSRIGETFVLPTGPAESPELSPIPEDLPDVPVLPDGGETGGEDPFLAPSSADPFALPPSGTETSAPPSSAPVESEEAPALEREAQIAASVQTEVSNAWLVMAPPFSDYESAKASVGELKSQGFDAYVLLKGDYRYGVVAGLFRKRANAERLGDRLRSKGFEIQVIPWTM